MEENLIAAIELGSSAISGVVGQKLANGTTEVLAYVSMPSESSVRHGVVYSPEIGRASCRERVSGHV